MVPTFCTMPGRTRAGEGDLEGPGEPKSDDWLSSSSDSQVIRQNVAPNNIQIVIRP